MNDGNDKDLTKISKTSVKYPLYEILDEKYYEIGNDFYNDGEEEPRPYDPCDGEFNFD